MVVAHPDDETFGCGGSIAHWGDCTVVAFTDGVTSRSHCAPRAAATRTVAFGQAMALLGVPVYQCLGLEDQRLDAYPLLYLAQAVEACLLRYGPDRVLTHHHGDLNRDHRIVAEAVLVATRPPARYEVLSFEVPSATEWAFGSTATFAPNVFVDITPTLERKCAAIACYRDEGRDPPHPRNATAATARAQYWGQMAGLLHAEAFQLHRGYR